MDKETLSNYGWIVICVLILAVMIALASPFGMFISSAIKNTAQGLFDTNDKALSSVGIDAGGLSFKEPAVCGIKDHYEGDGIEHGVEVTNCKNGHKYTCECGWTVPEGGTYYVGVTSTTLGDYTGATKVYNAGEKLSCESTPKNGDVFVLGDYEYRYNYFYSSSWSISNTQNGWGVRVLNTSKTSYGEILDHVANKPVTNMQSSFYNCKSLIISPQIPDNVTNMQSTFLSCTSLTTPPVIPNGVTNIAQMFQGCTQITTAPTIPNTVIYMHNTFKDCTNLKTYMGSKDVDGDFSNYKLPDNITNLSYTFMKCIYLKQPPVIPNNVNSMEYTFCVCESLTTAPTIPNNVKNLWQTFAGCTNLKTYVGSKDPDGDFSNYNIPDGVTNMQTTFSGCKYLTHPPVIPNSVTDMRNTFSDCTSLIQPCNISTSTQLISCIFMDCTSLTTAPIIPNGVTDIGYMFKGCKNLKTYIGSKDADGNFSNYIIPNSVDTMSGTFDGCALLTKAPTLSPNVKYIWEIFRGCTSLTTAPAIPDKVTNAYSAFSGCISLTGIIEINANLSYHSDFFYKVNFKNQNLTLTGSSTILDEIGKTGSNYCTTCNGKCLNNH